MKSYYRIMLGRQSMFAQECCEGCYIGADFDIDQDLSAELPERWQDFNHKFRPVWLEKNPEKSKVSAGLACGFLHTICKGINKGDIVLCPDGDGAYMVGEVTEPYSYHPGTHLPHRRGVRWLDVTIARSGMSQALKHSTGSIGTVSNVTQYAEELEQLIGGQAAPALIASDENVEDPVVFALETHLEEFLFNNWQRTELGRKYDIYEDESGNGRQYKTDTGSIDILAISKDKRELLVVELKRGRASDVVVGQVQRYMGDIMELAEENQTVKGVIIALEDDLRLRRALRVTQNIDFYRYEVNFTLRRG